MEKYDFIKCMNIHKKLKELIRGEVNITMETKTRMSISINGTRGIKYRSYIDNVPEKIDIDKYVDHIIGDYEDFILEKYFIM